jgi:Domain of unknown function (DUF4190)
MSQVSPGPGWWLASDGRWYPPELAPQATASPPTYPSSPGVAAPVMFPTDAYPVFATRAATNGLAVASLVLGIIWLYWVGSILALVFGYVALIQIRERHESGRGLAIAGIVLGWVGVGTATLAFVTALLVALTGSGS